MSRKFSAKKEAVRKFLSNLRGYESYYRRNKSKRIYLSSELNISKLHKQFQTSVENNLKVKFPLFYKIFEKEYNIGFSSPASDLCALCTRLKIEINEAKQDQKKSETLRTQLRIHKLRANAFYDTMRQSSKIENSITISFDLQQVQPLPKTPIQDYFYSRQLAFYSFCCVGISSRDPHFYTWSEYQAERGSTEIASALLHHLLSLNIPHSVDTIPLFCDGCAGQNRNAHLLHSLSLA